MNIKLHGYEVIHAIEYYLKDKYGIDFDFERDCYENPSLSYHSTVYAPKKHKNGKVMKDPDHGFVLREAVGREQTFATWDFDCELTFYLAEIERRCCDE